MYLTPEESARLHSVPTHSRIKGHFEATILDNFFIVFVRAL